MQEPTTGLDSSSALTVMEILCDLAKQEGKIVMLVIHQPSSQMFHMFNELLLIAKGKVSDYTSISSVCVCVCVGTCSPVQFGSAL